MNFWSRFQGHHLWILGFKAGIICRCGAASLVWVRNQVYVDVDFLSIRSCILRIPQGCGVEEGGLKWGI